MRRFIVLAATLVAVLASTLSASAATRQPVPRQAPLSSTAVPARHAPALLLAADIAAAKQGAAQAILTRIVAQHTAHLAHARHTAHAQHLHLLYLRQLALWASQARARAAAAQPATAPVRDVTSPAASTPRYSTSAPAVTTGATYTGGSGIQQCIIARESGGNSQVMNSTSHYGLYQFDAGTWASGGGNPGDFGHASVAEQNQVFASVYAARGAQPWSASDGC